MASIDPKILKGFRDFLPEKQIARERMIDTIKASYESFGFDPFETPALEYADILTGKYGDEGDKLMYRFRDNGDRDVALRYDLTIPLARVMAQNGDLKKPFKRYQVSPVWRADNPQKGRFREFYQCDADIVGSNSPLADAEILALAANTLKRLGVKDFVIRINSREIISSFYDSLGLTSDQKTLAIRAVDKIDKIGVEGVKKELVSAKFSDEVVDSIIEFAAVSIDALSNRDELDNLIAQKEFSPIEESVKKLLTIVESAALLAPDTAFVLDFSIARGLDYYTGLIFETNLTDAPTYGSVLSGGRYDGLIGMFSNRPIPAVGASIGLDRLIAALDELKLIKEQKTVAKIIVVNFDETLTDEYLKMSSELRESGLNTIVYFETTDLKKQLAYANDKGIQYALLYGANEAKEEKVIIKNLMKGTQEVVGRKDLVSYLKKYAI